MTSFYPEPDDGRITMTLVHYEDRMHDGRDYGPSRLVIALQSEDGAKADVLLDAADVAFLASKLARYSRELEDPDREWWDTQERLTAGTPLA